MGLAYSEGVGIIRDMDKANAYWHKAVEFGDDQSMVNLGTAYVMGNFGDDNRHKGFPILKQAEQLGNKDSFFWIASAYRNGYGVTKDLQKTIEYFEKSAESGYVNAQSSLVTIYLYDEKNYKKAIFYHQIYRYVALFYIMNKAAIIGIGVVIIVLIIGIAYSSSLTESTENLPITDEINLDESISVEEEISEEPEQTGNEFSVEFTEDIGIETP